MMMDTETIILIILAAALLILAVTFIAVGLRQRSQIVIRDERLSFQKQRAEKERIGFEQAIAQGKADHEKALEEAREHYSASLREMNEAHERDLQKQIEALKAQMTADTEKLLKARQEELNKENEEGLDKILSPLKESMDKMKEAMDANAKEHIETTATLRTRFEQAVKEMNATTEAIGTKAEDLSVALTGRPKVQGCWGENYLDDILANEGLTNGLQYTREDAREDRSRPDFIFHFKEGLEQKDLVVDSKVSLTAFVEYVNADDEQSREEALKRHLASVRKHISELAAKEYAKKVDQGRRFADYVLMFMPIDSAYRVAAAEDPMLWSDAYSKGVLIATEQTIMPFLKIMQLTWNKYQQDTNILKVTKAAEDMIERVGQFYDSYKDLGNSLKAACNKYNAGIGKLRDNGYSITTSARNVMKIGVKRAKGLELTAPDATVYLDAEHEAESGDDA